MPKLSRLREQLKQCYRIQKETEEMIAKLEFNLFRRTREIFEEMDTNNSGYVSVWEYLVYSMKEMDPGLSEEALLKRSELKMKRFRGVDLDKNELLDFSEVFAFQKTLLQ